MVGNIFVGCLFVSVLTIWCNSSLKDARAILSVKNLYLAVCTRFETMRFACLYKSMKIVNFVFYHILSTCHLSNAQSSLCIYIYIYIKCIVTNKYASRVLEYNYTNSQKIIYIYNSAYTKDGIARLVVNLTIISSLLILL